jgi:hypothetical protein
VLGYFYFVAEEDECLTARSWFSVPSASKQPGETQEHLYECADHMAVEEWFQARFRLLEPREDMQIDPRMLRP